MSNIIEKITLYDLLGYTVPGTILVTIWGYVYLNNICMIDSFLDCCKDYAGYLFTALFICGYVIGIAISELTYILSKIIEKREWFMKENEIGIIGYNIIAKALKQAGLIQDENEIKNMKDAQKYIRCIYGIMQADSKYSRLHNYASSELICRNLSFVALNCGIAVFCVTNKYIAILFGIILAGIYMERWKKQHWRKKFYTVSWFVDKYLNSSSPKGY